MDRRWQEERKTERNEYKPCGEATPSAVRISFHHEALWHQERHAQDGATVAVLPLPLCLTDSAEHCGGSEVRPRTDHG
jgi:hypothetical protein